MSMDPTKWIEFSSLTDESRQRVESLYPYLKVDTCQFQEKDSGVFMRQGNSVKIEKLLDPPGYGPRKPEPAAKARK